MGFNNLSPEDADDWFKLQAKWTFELREYICRKIKIRRFTKFLELGSGTGILLKYFRDKCETGEFTGVESDSELAGFCSENNPELIIKNSDSIDYLKNTRESFDIITTHFYLMWDKNYKQVLERVKLLLKSDGYFLIIAEPDYGGVLESPESIRSPMDIRSITFFNGDPYIGRKLPSEIKKSGFKLVEHGLISKMKSNLFPTKEEFLNEFESYKLFWNKFETEEKIIEVKEKIINHIERGEYFYFLPLMYFILRP